MTQKIAEIIAGMLPKNHSFVVGDGHIWVPGLCRDSFFIAEHLCRALEIHGFDASRSFHRAYHGVSFEVNGAESVDSRRIQEAMSAGYGYSGRVCGLDTNSPGFAQSRPNPGDLIEIPAIEWVGDETRVSIGEGVYVQINTTNVEKIRTDDEFEVPSLKYRPRKGISSTPVNFAELIENEEVIIKKGEFTGYFQTSY